MAQAITEIGCIRVTGIGQITNAMLTAIGFGFLARPGEQRPHQRNFGIENLDRLFEKVYYSFDYKLRKPDAKFYQTVLDENGLQASETLFIDDMKENIEGAERVGINGYWLQSGESVIDVISNFSQMRLF